MVSQLVSIKELQGENPLDPPRYTLKLNRKTLATLLENFSGRQVVYPLLSLGHNLCGRSGIFDALLHQADPDNTGGNSQGPFESAEKEEGVTVWPHPIQLGDKTLMLLKLSGIDFLSQSEEMEVRKKLIYTCLSITSVSFICLHNQNFFQSLKSILGIYNDVSQVAVSKFFVFMEQRDTFSKGKFAKEFRDFQSYTNCQPFYRGRDSITQDCLREVLKELNSDEIHRDFIRTHSRMQTLLDIENFSTTLTSVFAVLVKYSNFDLNYESFVEASQVNRSSDQLMQMIEQEKRKMEFDKVEAYKLFDKIGESYCMDPKISALIEETYNPEDSIVVIVIMGHQGKGKSTLLNHIVQRVLQRRKLKMFFKHGSSGRHTTRGSLILSKPVYLPGTQQKAMLIDLEGLEAVEESNPRDMMLQRHLVKSILTIASVPCIIIDNSLDSLQFAERMIDIICDLQVKFSFQVSRIHFLHHDADLLGAEMENEAIAEKVAYLNAKYFHSQEVIKVMNKPNFDAEAKIVMRSEFLDLLLSDCNYPKRFLSGTAVTISQMLAQIEFMLQSEDESYDDIKFGIGEREEAERYLEGPLAELDQAYSLLSCGHEKISGRYHEGSIILIQKSVHHSPNPKWKKFIVTTLKRQAIRHRLQLSEIERCFEVIQATKEEALIEQISVAMLYLYYKARHYSGWVEELERKLERVKSFYPRLEAKVDRVLAQPRPKCTHHDERVSEIVASCVTAGAVGLVLVCGAIIGVAIYVGAIAGMRIIGEVRKHNALKIYCESAYHLFDMPETSREVALEPKLMEWLKRFQPRNPAKVLLVLGTQEMNIDLTLNQFIKMLVPFTPALLRYFTSWRSSQVLPFTLWQTGEESVAECQGMLVYLEMTNEQESPQFRNRNVIAATLLKCASAASFIIDTKIENPFIQPLIDYCEASSNMQRVSVLVADKREAQTVMACISSKFPMAKVSNLPTDGEQQLEWMTGLKQDLENSEPISIQQFSESLHEVIRRTSK